MDWFWNLEAAFTIRLYRPLILPPNPWRDQALRIRRESMDKEYPLLWLIPREIQLDRLLHDAWQQYWTILPTIIEAFLTVMSLNRVHGKQHADAINVLGQSSISLCEHLTKIKESPAWSVLFEKTEVDLDAYSRLHSDCCPPPPFHSLLKYNYPPAAGLDMLMLACLRLVQRHIYTPVKHAGFPIEMLEKALEKSRQQTYDIARIFAAIEEEFQGYPGALMPHLRPFIMVGSDCSEELREWFWYKLAHFEESGSTFMEPLKRQLAILWGIPELAPRGFVAMKRIGPSLQTVRQVVDPEAFREVGKLALEAPSERPPVVEKDDLDLNRSL